MSGEMQDPGQEYQQPIETQLSLSEVQELKRAMIEREFSLAEIQHIKEDLTRYNPDGNFDNTPGYRRRREEEFVAGQQDLKNVAAIDKIRDRLDQRGISSHDLMEYIAQLDEV